MYKEIKITEVSREVLEGIQKGAFLTVKNQGKVNTMTIGWGSIGYVWSKHIFTAFVRYSRYTHEIINNSKDFTVSIPLSDCSEDINSNFFSKSPLANNGIPFPIITGSIFKIISSIK